jgi:predicted AAA+ superfamily ATPase
MPELLRLTDEDRREWLRSYQQTYLERDLADLTRLSDLEPFRALQTLCALRSGRLLSYAELGRDAGISAQTARRYITYLNISYQVVLLRPFRRNLTSALIKSPKIHWVDLGLQRHVTRQWGELTGEQFETLVVGEIHKWCSTMARDVALSFYRTRSGLEVDLMLQTSAGILGIEIKNRARVVRGDSSALRSVGSELGTEWLGGLVVYRGDRVERLDEELGIWAVPIHRLV